MKARTIAIVIGVLSPLLCAQAFLPHRRKAFRSAASGAPATNLAHQWDASTLTGSDGDLITNLASTTGGTTLTNVGGGVRPTLQTVERNGLNVLRFDGTDDTMATGAFGAAITQPFTMFAVIKLNSVAATQRFLSETAELGGARFIYRVDTSPSHQFYAGSAFQGYTIVNATTTWAVLSMEINGASTKIRVNNNTEETLSSPGTAGLAALRVSGDYDGTINPTSADVAEILIYTGTIADKSAHFSYLNTKWGF